MEKMTYKSFFSSNDPLQGQGFWRKGKRGSHLHISHSWPQEERPVQASAGLDPESGMVILRK